VAIFLSSFSSERLLSFFFPTAIPKNLYFLLNQLFNKKEIYGSSDFLLGKNKIFGCTF